ncbi:MAG: hypothetical protein ACTHMM_10105 [Agriterribacter sp.]
MEEGLKIKIGADTRDVEKGLKTVNKEIADFSTSVSKGIKTAGFDDLTTKLRNMPDAATRANQSLVDLGRVAQDLPFGFVGIANNLNPLFDSFSRLRKESGSTGGALKALATSLTGPGGFGLALSLVSSALTITSIGLGAWTRGFGDANKKVVEMSGYLETTKDQLNQINSKFAEEASRVTQLVVALESGTLSHQQIKSAKQELIRISPQYFSNLDIESAKINEVTAAYTNYNNSLIKAIENQIKTDKLTASIQRRLQTEEKNPLGLAEFQKLLKTGQSVEDIMLRIVEKPVKNIRTSLAAVSGLYSNVGAAARQALIDQDRATSDVADQNAELERQLLNVARAYKDVKDIAGTIDPELIKVTPSALKKVKDQMAQAFKVQSVEIPVVFRNTNGIESLEGYRNFRAKAQQDLKDHPLYLEVETNLKGFQGIDFSKIIGYSRLKAELERVKAIVSDFNNQTTQILRSGFTDAFSGVGETIGSLISEGSNGLSAFASIGVALSNVLINVGKAAIGTGIAILGIQKALKSLNPYVAIAAGVALVALGSVIKNKLSESAPGMATGGIVPPGYPNDSFPARLSSNEAVIPLDRLDSIMGGGSGNGGVLTARVSGNDLLFILNRAGRSNGRSF